MLQKSRKFLLTAWLLTAVMLSQLILSFDVFATETATSGTDGNISWAIDNEGVLTITGKKFY